MRRIGAGGGAGRPRVEYILCSGDPDSLDGVYIPALGVGYADGTAPHILDPALFGVTGSYLDVGECCARVSTPPRGGRSRSSQGHTANTTRRPIPTLPPPGRRTRPPAGRCLWSADREAARRRAQAAAGRELSPGRRGRRGAARALPARHHLPRRGLLRGHAGGPLPARLRAGERPRARGRFPLGARRPRPAARLWAQSSAANPLDPERPDAPAHPRARRGLCRPRPRGGAAAEAGQAAAPGQRAPARRPKETRRALDADRRAAASLRRCGVEPLASAKRLHDELEAVYRPYVSFPALDEAPRREISTLGL